MRNEAGNPYIIDGVAVIKGNEVLLFLYQIDPNAKQDLYWQQWDESEPLSKLFRYMRESGIRYDILRLNIKSSGFSDEELAKLDKFVVGSP